MRKIMSKTETGIWASGIWLRSWGLRLPGLCGTDWLVKLWVIGMDLPGKKNLGTRYMYQ